MGHINISSIIEILSRFPEFALGSISQDSRTAVLCVLVAPKFLQKNPRTRPVGGAACNAACPSRRAAPSLRAHAAARRRRVGPQLRAGRASHQQPVAAGRLVRLLIARNIHIIDIDSSVAIPFQ